MLSIEPQTDARHRSSDPLLLVENDLSSGHESKSAVTPSSDQSGEGRRAENSHPLRSEQAPTSSKNTSDAPNSTMSQRDVNKRVANQLRDVATFTENLREQLATQTHASEQLRAELATLRAENDRSISVCESKLDGFSEMLKLTRTTLSAQQGHVDNLDRLHGMELVDLKKRLSNMEPLLDRSPDFCAVDDEGSLLAEAETTKSVLKKLETSVAVMQARLNGNEFTKTAGLEQTILEQTNVGGLGQLEAMAATGTHLPFVMEGIALLLRAAKDGNSRGDYEQLRTGFVDRVMATIDGSSFAVVDEAVVRTALEQRLGFDRSRVEGFITAIKDACAEPAIVLADSEAKTKRVDSLDAPDSKLSNESTTTRDEVNATSEALKSELGELTAHFADLVSKQRKHDSESEADPSTTSTGPATNAYYNWGVVLGKDGDVTCSTCGGPVTHYSLTPCNHLTCLVCCLRRRAFDVDLACTTCKKDAPVVIFTDSWPKDFADYDRKDFFCTDGNLGIKCETLEITQDVVSRLRYRCPDPYCDFTCVGWTNIEDHIRAVHLEHVA